MCVHVLLLSIALSCSAEAFQDDQQSQRPVAMTMHASQSPAQAPPPCPCPAPDLSALTRDHQQEAQWRTELLALLSQLVSGQKEVAGGQVEVLKLLGTLANQGSQQILDLQNMARHQSLLVENNQALLLQTSRIATHLQGGARKPDGQ